MIVPAQTLPPMSPEAYLDYERESDFRHELVDGYLNAMTDVSDRHEELVANLLAAIHRHLGQGGCRVYGANLKIRVGDDFFYPDLFVRCAKERGDPFFKTDPLLVIEVLSPNTQRYDRGDKRLAYQSLPSLAEYVLVSEDAPRIEVFRRTAGGWDRLEHHTPEATLDLASIGLRLRLADIYA